LDNEINEQIKIKEKTMKKLIILQMLLLSFFLSGCELINKITGDYDNNILYFVEQGMPLSKVEIYKDAKIDSGLPSLYNVYEITSDFELIEEALNFRWKPRKFRYAPPTEFDQSLVSYVLVFYVQTENSTYTNAGGIFVYPDYLITYGPNFYKFDEQKLGKLYTYLAGLSFELKPTE
jgi:hypothetical protein